MKNNFISFFSIAFSITVFALGSVFGPSNVSAQSAPVSPDAWSFMKYGNTSVNMYTGAASAQIPIYTYKDNDFEIPITFDYVSQGFVPNMPAGSLGVGWFLNAGGMITREVNEIPDEYTRAGGFEDGYYTYDDYVLQGYYSYYKMMSGPNPPSAGNPVVDDDNICYRLNDSARSRTEISPDIFTFNFMGHRGKFHMSGADIAVYETTEPNGEYKIDLSGFRAQRSVIKITTGDGYVYTFGGLDSHSFRDLKTSLFFTPFTMQYYGDDSGVDEARYGAGINVSAFYKEWQLTSIKAPSGREVLLEYSDRVDVDMVMPVGSAKFVIGGSSGKDEKDFSFGISKYTFGTRQLEHIDVDDYRIDFVYNEEQTTEWSAQVEGGGKYATIGLTSREIDGTYYPDGPPGDPVRTRSVHRLDRITIGRHGSSTPVKTIDMRYDSLGVKEYHKQQKLFLTGVNIPGTGLYEMGYLTGDFPVNGIPAVDYWGFVNSDSWAWGKVADFLNINQVYMPNQQFDLDYRKPNFNFSRLGMLDMIVYPTGGFTKFEYEPNFATSYVGHDVRENNGFPRLKRTDSLIEAGGLRVKRIVSSRHPYDNIGRRFYQLAPTGDPADTLLTVKEYIYEDGNILYFPIYQTYTRVRKSGKFRTTQTVSPLNLHVYSFDKSHIEYGRVTEKYGDGSRKVYTFSTYATVPDYMPEHGVNFPPNPELSEPIRVSGEMYVSPDSLYIPSKNWDNFNKQPVSKAFLRGRLKSVSSYDSNEILLANEVYEDGLSDILGIGHHAAYKKEWRSDGILAYETFRYTDNYRLGRSSETKYFTDPLGEQKSVSTHTEYSYNELGQVSSMRKYHIDTPLEIPVIMSSSTPVPDYSKYITETTEVEYLSPDTAESYSDLMIVNELHIVNLPKEIIRSIENPADNNGRMLVSGIKNTYLNGKLNYVEKAKAPIHYSASRGYELETTHSYDSQGRQTETIDKNGVRTAYVWGYCGLHAVAVIEDAPEYSEIVATIGENILEAPLAGALTATQATNLRNMSQGRVTTYAYEPLVGVTYMTDPTGRVTSNTYDTEGRLLSVKDELGNTIYKYSYSTANK